MLLLCGEGLGRPSTVERINIPKARFGLDGGPSGVNCCESEGVPMVAKRFSGSIVVKGKEQEGRWVRRQRGYRIAGGFPVIIETLDTFDSCACGLIGSEYSAKISI